MRRFSPPVYPKHFVRQPQKRCSGGLGEEHLRFDEVLKRRKASGTFKKHICSVARTSPIILRGKRPVARIIALQLLVRQLRLMLGGSMEKDLILAQLTAAESELFRLMVKYR